MNSVHNPTFSVKLADGSIAIRELSWPDAMHLYKCIKEQLQRYMGDGGELKFDSATIIAAITENIDLGIWLVKQCTGKDDEWLNQRSVSEVLDIAAEAAVLNVEIIAARIKNGGSRLRQAVAGANTNPKSSGPESTPASPTKPSS